MGVLFMANYFFSDTQHDNWLHQYQNNSGWKSDLSILTSSLLWMIGHVQKNITTIESAV